jgi:ADP-heptose:LPS heptosyltransferase
VLPPCDVPELAAVIERLAGMIGTDSGPRHLAAALGRPTFAWFGPTHPDNWTALDPAQGVWWTAAPCRGCNRT